MASKKKNITGSCFLQICCLIMFIIGLIVGCQLLHLAWLRMDSKNWIETDAVVESCELLKHSGSRGGTTYSLNIVYKYVWAEKEYTGSRYDFSHEYRGRKPYIQEIADRYPPGKPIVCYVNPDNPESSVIIRGAAASSWGMGVLVIIVMAFTGLCIVVFSMKFKAPKQRRKKLKQVRNGYYSLGTSGGTQELFGCLWVTVIVVVITGLLVYFFYKGPFVIVAFVAGGIGILTILLFLLHLFGYGNSFCEIQINKPVVYLDDEITLQWHFPAAVREKKLIILLSGTEEFSDEKTTVPDSSLFYSQLLLMLEPPESEEGQLKFTIPQGTMPTAKLEEVNYFWKVEIYVWSGDEDFIGTDFILPVAPAHLKGRSYGEI